MSGLRAVSPAPLSAVLELAPASRRMRQAAVCQAHGGETIAVYDDEGPLAVVALYPSGTYREFCLSIAPRAAGRMLPLVRACHLMLARVAETGSEVRAYLKSDGQPARMARLVGFRPAGTDKFGSYWSIERKGGPNERRCESVDGADRHRRRRRRRRGKGRTRKPAGTTGGE